MTTKPKHSVEEFPLVSTSTATVRDSDDESTTSEETTFFMSNKAERGSRKNKNTSSTQNSNRGFAFAVIGTIILITLVIIAYIIYSIASSSQATSAFNQTATDSSNKPTGSFPGTASSNTTQNQQIYQTSPGELWHKDLVAATEFSTIVHDMNQDGIQDIIFVTIITERLEQSKYRVCPNEENSCLQDLGFIPCQIHLVSLDGRNGNVVWEKWIPFDAFAANCKHDLNRDGIPDCTFSGRHGSFAAVNPVDQSYLWFIDSALTFPTYNYYYPLFIRDFDNDGVIDIIITHGGDAVYGDDTKDRSPGFIFVVSGRTGQQLSERILMPDGRETYNSPVAFNVSGSIEVILFGSGGETIAGSLWTITVQSLQDNVDTWAPNKPKKYDLNKNYFDVQCLSDEEIRQTRPIFMKGTFKHVQEKEDWLAKCPVWNDDIQPLWNPYKVCVYELVPAGRTGTITPPVIIDYNGDGIKDLLVSQFNDHIMMIDGATTSVRWDHYSKGTQSYSIPSPLHFNNDDTPDFLVRFNKGKWMTYDYSYMGIIDGTNGELLWSLNCSLGVMSSGITIKSRKKGQDGILFLASGCEEKSMMHKKDVSAGKKVFHTLEQSICPTAHWGIELSICVAANDRNKRQEGDPAEDKFEPTEGTGKDHHEPEVLRPVEIDISEISEDDIWLAKDETDSFPDPWSDTRSFFQDYCGISYEHFISKVYFLTPNIIKYGKIKPIITNYPYIYKAPNTFYAKRHGQQNGENRLGHSLVHDRKKVRCAHILVPLVLAGTPTLGDFNNDGKLDAALSVTYDGYPNELYMVRQFHPPKLSIDVVTLEEKMKEIYGSDIDKLVDFSEYYPAEKQPWGRYMGSRGDGVYEDPFYF